MNFPDANVWLALLWERHSRAELARDWFEDAQDQQFLFCRFTQLTVLRLLTNEAVMGRDAKGMRAAWELYDRCLEDERIAFLPEPDAIELRLRSLGRSRLASPKAWADAYLTAFASAAGLKLVTFDKALRSKGVDCLVLGSR